MSRGVKIGLIVLGTLIVLGGGTCGAFFAWVKSNETEWQERGKEAKRDGQLYGAAKHTQADCLEEALRRAAPCEDKGALAAGQCQAFAGVFLDQCMHAARPADVDVCAGVPEEQGVLSLIKYSKDKCEARGSLSETCMKIHQNLASVCRRLAQRADK